MESIKGILEPGNDVTIDMERLTGEELKVKTGAFMALCGEYPRIEVRGVCYDEATGESVPFVAQHWHEVIRERGGFWLVFRAGIEHLVRPHVGVWQYVRLSLPTKILTDAQMQEYGL